MFSVHNNDGRRRKNTQNQTLRIIQNNKKNFAIRNVLNEAKVMLNYDSYDENMVEI